MQKSSLWHSVSGSFDIENIASDVHLYARRGNVVEVYLDGAKLSTALPAGANLKIGTLPAKCRPAMHNHLSTLQSTDISLQGKVNVLVSRSGEVTLRNFSGVAVPTTSAIGFSATFLT